MGYLRDDEFMELVKIVEQASPADRMDMLCRRITEMDRVMRYVRDRERQGEEIDEQSYSAEMTSRWITLAEIARACNYIARKDQVGTIPRVVREWLQGVAEQHVGVPIEITEIHEVSEDEFRRYMGAELITEEQTEERPNPFFQKDGKLYPFEDSSREPGEPGTHRVDKSIAGVSDQLSETFLKFFSSLDKGKEPPTP